MKTQRLYFDDPYLFDFTATVKRKFFHKGKPAVVLDQTCFYPESGGQPHDRGLINGIEVREVIDGDEIVHILAAPLKTEKAEGHVDAKVRLDHMQQHAGQHVLSQCFLKQFDAATTSFHLGSQSSTVELDLKEINEQGVLSIEEMANGIVFENRKIKTYFVDEQALATVPLRKPPLKKGRIRVVEIEGFDHTACGGTHPQSTGEIGLIKILKSERIRNRLRFEFVCGWRALQDYVQKHRDIRSMANSLTIKENEVLGKFEDLQAALKLEKRRGRKLWEKSGQFEAELLIKEKKGQVICQGFKHRPVEDIRHLASMIISKGDFIALLGTQERGSISIVIGRSETFDLDLRDCVPEISSLLGGKGGGQPSFIQVTGSQEKNIEKALETAKSFIQKKLA